MTTQEDILRAVIAEPESDQVRLICADWMEEHGQLERAEFIRVQCRIATMTSGCVVVLRQDCDGSRFEWCNRCREMYRERELLSRHKTAWLPLPTNNNTRGNRAGFMVGRDQGEAIFERGFVSGVSLPCAAWLYHGPRLVRAAPLTRVVLTDKKPYHNAADHWLWDNIDGVYPFHSVLPPYIFALLEDMVAGFAREPWRAYRTRQAALDALSMACLTWARQQTP